MPRKKSPKAIPVPGFVNTKEKTATEQYDFEKMRAYILQHARVFAEENGFFPSAQDLAYRTTIDVRIVRKFLTEFNDEQKSENGRSISGVMAHLALVHMFNRTMQGDMKAARIFFDVTMKTLPEEQKAEIFKMPNIIIQPLDANKTAEA